MSPPVPLVVETCPKFKGGWHECDITSTYNQVACERALLLIERSFREVFRQ